MRHRLGKVALLFAAIPLFLTLSAGPSSSEQLPAPGIFTNSGYEVEPLSADTYAGGTILLVKGQVRNLSSTSIKGYVIVHLQTENREELGTFETEVNKNTYFDPGKTGQIEATINIGQYPNVKNVFIEFVRR